MSNLPFVHKVLSDPLLVNAAYSDLIVSMLDQVATNHPGKDMAGTDADGDFWSSHAWARPYHVVNGVLQIKVTGMLLNKFPYQFGELATGYDYIRAAFVRGMGDTEVHSIAMLVDSPGGVVSGCFDLSDEIFEMRGTKPIKAFVNDGAYSAAYALASAADTMTVTRSGGTGSVGVVTAHVDISKSMEERGIVHTFIFAGSHKVDGNAYEKLPDDVKARIQERIDRTYADFVNVVARNRGLSVEVVQGTEALIYDANDSLAIGFADAVGKFDDELAAFERDTAQTEISAMADDFTHTAADVDAARTEGVNAGKQESQDRIKTILNSDEAKARPIAAVAAIHTTMSGEDAVTFLGALPEEKAEAPVAPVEPKLNADGTPFDAAMADGAPEVGANAVDDDDDAEDGLTADQRDYRAMAKIEEAASATGTTIQ